MADELSREQKIARLQQMGIAPPSSGAAPSGDETELTREQKIQMLTKAGVTPPQGGSGNSFLDANPTMNKMVQGGINDLPLLGNLVGGAIGGGAGAVLGAGAGTAALPVVGTVTGGEAGALAGGSVGAGLGGAAGSALKDTLNSWIYGKNKSAGDIALDATKEGAIDTASQLAGGVAFKVGGNIIGAAAEKVVPKAVIERYKQAASAIKELIGNSDGDTAEAAKQVRDGMSGSLDQFRDKLNTQIEDALGKSTERVNPGKVIDTLESMRGRVHEDLPSANAYHAQIDSYIESLNKMRDENGMIFVSDMNSLKRDLQNQATAAYRGGTNGLQFADAAQQAAGAARGLVNKAVPELASINDRLAALHVVEDNMNKSILKEGASAAGIIGAGEAKTEAGKASAKALRTLSEITGQDFLGKAQDVAAVKAFGADSLYKRGVGASVGAAAGAGIAEMGGNDPYHGAMIGGALGGVVTSPAAVKTGIDAARYITPAMSSVGAQTLGQAVMHGTGAAQALRKAGPQP